MIQPNFTQEAVIALKLVVKKDIVSVIMQELDAQNYANVQIA